MYDAVLGIGGDGSAAAERLGVPFVALPKALYVEVLPHENALTRTLLRWHAHVEMSGARAAALVIAPSRFAAAVVHTRFGVPWSAIEVIPEPFAASRWRATLPETTREGRRVLLVAHLYPRKRVVDVLRAWPAVRRVHPRAVLDIAGDGPQRAALRRLAARLDGVRMLGHVGPERLRELHSQADVFVSASAHETFGYAVVEALASGLPVVAADAPAVMELCEDAVGERVAVGDVDGLARGIIAALDPNIAAAAARTNPGLASRFEVDAVGAGYVEAIGALTG
jgi:glycosyltransferase involved in cell wall biosynthesis